MAASRRSTRPRFILLVLVLAAITLVTIDARAGGDGVLGDVRTATHDVFAPLQDGTHDVLRPVGNFLSGAVHYGSLRQENQRLRNQITSLEANGIQAAAEQSQAQQLMALQNLPFVGQIPTVDAGIINQGSSNFETSVTINRGSSSGVATGQPVVSAGGLVGTVTQVGSHTATVQLLTDPSFAVGVRVDANNTGSAQGSGRGNPLRVTIDTPGAPPPKVTKGQPIVTSGLQLEKFPPTIPVGTVDTVTTPTGAVEPQITLKPLVNLSQLSTVAILLWSPQ